MDLLTSTLKETPPHTLFAAFLALIVFAFYGLYAILHLIAPKPRPVLPSEKTYITTTPTGTATRQLPCWHDRWLADRHASEARSKNDDPTELDIADTGSIEPAEVRMSVVFPAYNEEDRILPTLKEAVEYLDSTFGRDARPNPNALPKTPTPTTRKHAKNAPREEEDLSGYEILIVNDGSRDRTVQVALEFAREHGLHDVLRVVTLERNRGKGGGVTHGLRHVRGQYALFADADGATRFGDLGRLLEGCEEVVDGGGRGVAIGSRGHLVGSDAVVRRSALRNFLMRSFHVVLAVLTPPATSRLRDTQCGFKLFTRAALPHVVPYMHAEGWIFDIEMLMLAESAPAVPVRGHDGAAIGSSPGIKVAEVPVDWHEVGGSKLNVIKDSVKMAVGLAVLRASWMMGVYRRRLT
ncbi:glycosyltransferase family 2 protein [Hypoxylon rubiginosum]|uniref:Glycosyltransferase family 2 protein n=1 Tax=Hypoxylon rubiginosum TaxID=110542 RepID=A0ACB9Z2S8_9PEZI|nr:glycosyltransferase family 2 protein [Hypoxylon rubiginosum]